MLGLSPSTSDTRIGYRNKIDSLAPTFYDDRVRVMKGAKEMKRDYPEAS